MLSSEDLENLTVSPFYKSQNFNPFSDFLKEYFQETPNSHIKFSDLENLIS